MFQKITRSSDYKLINREGNRLRTDSLFLRYLRRNDQVVRVGCTASRKVGCAVDRNKAKRRMRELTRLCFGEFVSGVSYVFIATDRVPSTDFQMLRSEFVRLLQKVKASVESAK